MNGEKFCSNCGTKIKIVKENQENNKKKSKKVIIIIIVLLSILLIGIGTFFTIDYLNKAEIEKELKNIKIELKQTEVKLEYGETLNADDLLIGYEGGEISIDNKVDFQKVGKYEIIYKVTTAKNREKMQTATVNIVDTVKPVINIKNEEITVELNTKVDILSGITAEDNYDKDITNKITTSGTVDTTVAGTYEIKYEVQDSNGNNAEVRTRKYTVKEKTKLKIGKTYRYVNTYVQNGMTFGSDWKVNIIDDKTAQVSFVDYSSGGYPPTKGSYKVSGNQLTITVKYPESEMDPAQTMIYKFTILDNGTLKYNSTGDIFK